MSARHRVGDALVTVIVPTYNHEAFLEQAVESVAGQQTQFPFRIWILDDASTDGTPALAERLRQRWPDIIDLDLQAENRLSRGESPSVHALSKIKTRYAAWCEGDDYWTSTLKLQRQVEAMEANPHCTISHHAVDVACEADGDHAFAETVRKWERDERNRQERVGGIEVAAANFIMTCSVMMRTDAIRPKALRAVFDVRPVDWILWSLALENGDICFIPEYLSAYRIHGRNMWAGQDTASQQDAVDRAGWFVGTYAEGPMRDKAREEAVGRWLDSNLGIRSVDSLRFQIAQLEARLDEAVAERDMCTEQAAEASRQAAQALDEAAQALDEAAQALDEAAREAAMAKETLARVVSSRGWRALEATRSLIRGRKN